MKSYRMLIFIVIVIALAIWIDVPNGGINIGGLSKNLDTRYGLDLVGGIQALLEADVPQGTNVSAEDMQTARAIVENRVNGLGVNETVVQLAGNQRIVVEIPGVQDPEQALSTIQETGLLEFVDFGSNPLPDGTEVTTDFAAGSPGSENPAAPTSESPTTGATLAPTVEATAAAAGADSTPEATPGLTPTAVPGSEQTYHTVMTGTDLNTVQVTTNSVGQYQIAFTLTSDGTRIFGDYTSANVGKFLGIVLDKRVISAPRVDSAITEGSGVITGNFTQASANALAVQLRYGSLPIPLKVVESRTVGPTLGQDSLRKSLVAGIIGLATVMLFMGLYYRLPGVVADLALIVYALITFALYKFIPVTLTLPGIAGFILSVGVAVDANVLIFERLKEELRAGRTIRQAIDLGWKRAWPSIRDSNISTLITTIILFWFGSNFGASIVKGFSLTLMIGVLVSMFTAIIVTRNFLHLVLDNVEFVEHPSLFGV